MKRAACTEADSIFEGILFIVIVLLAINPFCA